MVGILIVSHSKEIAEGTKKMANQMKQEDIPLEAVGGTKDGHLGTDADMIYKKLEDIEKDDGLIILTDLGSSVMNVEMAIENFSEEIHQKIRIANAPIVEGAIYGAVEASLNHDIDQVLSAIETIKLLDKRNE